MQRKTMLFVSAAVSLIAIAVPGAANAAEAKNFVHNGSPLASNAVITTHGTAGFTSSAGGFTCPTTGSVTLEPGSTGKVTAWDPSSTAGCTYSGNLDNLCGTVDTHKSTGLPWTAHGTKSGSQYKIGFTIHIDFGGTGIFCPDVTIHGKVTFIAVTVPGWCIHIIHGRLTSNLGTEVEYGGEQPVTPSGTYGVES